jgi:hypothetical protein
MSYPKLRADLIGVINTFLSDMDEVYEDTSLSSEDKATAFQAVADKHGMPIPNPHSLVA